MNTLSITLLAIPEILKMKSWIVTLGGFLIVICSLIILFFLFALISKILNTNWKNISRKRLKSVDNTKRKGTALDTNNDIIVAIGLALALSSEVHDIEYDEITIVRQERRYSPWNSKIYGLNILNKR